MKTRGRPRKFDETEALDRALKVFWAKGYDAATLDDLVAGTGVGRPSLYATFGDKTALFLRCLTRYIEAHSLRTVEAMEAEPAIRDAVRAFLRRTVEIATPDGLPRGCMMGSVASVVAEPAVRDFTVPLMPKAAEYVEGRLAAAVAAGQLPADFPCALRGRQVVDLARGLSLRARLGESREDLFADADGGADLICPPGPDRPNPGPLGAVHAG